MVRLREASGAIVAIVSLREGSLLVREADS